MTPLNTTRGRPGHPRGWLLALVLVAFGYAVSNVGTQAPSAPILLITSSGSSNPFGPYLGEILRAEGLNQFSTKDLAGVTATDLTSASVVVLAETPLTGAQATLLSNYVAGGGRLVAMRPDNQIAPVLGLTPVGSSLSNGYVAISSATSFADGFPATTLPFHGSATNYTTGGGGSVLASLYSSATVPTGYPAVVKSGRTVTWAYDLARAVVYTRQGRPENAADRDGQPPYRTTDLFYNAIDRDKVNIPYADVQMRMFTRTISDLLADAMPVPRLWYFPNAKKTLVVLTSDSHSNPQSYYDAVISSVASYGGRTSIYVNGGGPSASSAAAWRAGGHEVGMHPSGYQSGRSLDAALQFNLSWFTGLYGVSPSATQRTHQVEWQGWVDGAKVAANYGIRLDTSYYTWGPAVTYPDGHQAHGYINGSGQPMRFVDQTGAIVPVYQQVTSLVDEALVVGTGSFSEGLTGAQATAVSRQIIDSSQAGDYAAVAAQFHVDYFGFGDVTTWATGTMDYARSLAIPMWTAQRWLDYTTARHATTMTSLSWSPAGKQLSLTVVVPTGSEAQSLALPQSFAGFALTSVAVDGVSTAVTQQQIGGRATFFVSVAAGSHSVAAVYNTPMPTASLTVAPATVQQGQSASLSWSTTNATSVSIDQGVGSVGPSGTRTVSPAVTTTYSVTATNTAGSVTFPATLTIIPPPPTITLTVNPGTIPAGDPATLTWSATNAGSVTIDQGIGVVGATGTRTVSPAATTTYTASVTNVSGSAAATTSLTVNPAPPGSSLRFNGSNQRARFTTLPPLTEFTVEGWAKRTADTGRWETFFSNVSAGYGVASVNVYVDGGNSDCGSSPPDQFAWAYSRVGGGWFIQCSGVSANLNAWHHVAVTRDGSNTARIFIDGVLRGTASGTVDPTTTGVGAFGIGDAADAVDEYFPGLLDEVRISGVARYGTTFTPQTSRFFPDPNTVALYHLDEGSGQTLTDASGNGRSGFLGTTASTEPIDPTWSTDVPFTGPPPVPTITSFAASPTTITSGSAATLSWSVANANTVTINQGIGAVAPVSSVAVSPTTTTVYTLSATNANGTSTATVTVTVTSGPPVDSAPTISVHPTSQTVTAGGNAAFTVVATGTPAPTYQWQVSTGGGPFTNLTNVPPYGGVTTGTLSVSNTTAVLSGNQYRAVAANGVAPDATSGAATLTVSPAPAPSPILLITSSTSSNPFGPYLGEILRAEGLNQFSSKDLAVVTATDLANASVVVLAETPLTGAQATLLSNYVAGGGRVVAMRPDAQIASVLGLTPAGTSLNNGYFAINYRTAFADGFPTTTLPFHGNAINYTPAVGASVLATLYSSSTVPTAYPAVIKAGRAVTWAYDLARAVVYTRQGRPENATDRDGLPPYRTTDLFYNAIDRDKVNVPYADVQMRMFARAITDLLADALPLPRLWHLPGTNRTLMILTGDAHANPQSYYESELASIEARGGKVSLYLSGGSDPSAAAVQAWRDSGHEVGMHPAAFQYGRSLDVALQSAQDYFTSVGIDPPSTTSRNHQLEWQGWVDAAKVAAARGVALDTSYYTWGPAVTYPDGHQAHGYINGSGQPMRFVDETGAIVPVYQQVTSLIDEALLVGGASELLTPSQAIAVSRQLIDSSQAGDYAAIATQFHVDYYNFGEVKTWAEGTMDYAQSLGIPMWTAERWLNYTTSRAQTSMTGFSWAAGPRQLSFTVGVPTSSEPQTVALPGWFGGFGITGASIDGAPATVVAQTIAGRDARFLSVAPGTHTVVATYTAAVPPPQHVPIAMADVASVQEAQTVVIPVLANDSDADGDPLTVVSTSPDPRALIVINPDQTISYSPHSGTCGVDTFSYSIDDGRGGTATATVTVNVTCVNGQVSHTTVADFGASCAVPTNTIVTLVGDGELRLAGTVGDEYGQPTLDPAKWVAGTWSGGGYAPAPVGGVLSLSNAAGAYVRSVSTLPVTTLESSARFTGLPWEHVGWGSLNFGGGYAIFSTYNNSTNLFARTSQDGSTEQQTNLGPIPSGFHTYRIERQVVSPTTNTVSYYVDGVLRAQHLVGTLGPMHVYQSHSGGTAQALDIDRLWVYPAYVGAGIHQSCTLDIGHTLSRWTTAEWSAATPAGTTLKIRTRTSPDGTSWSGWSAPLTISGQDITSPAGRYLQYRAEFASTDASLSAVLDSVAMRFVDNAIPLQRAPIAISDAASTTEGSPVTVQVLLNDSDPDGDPVSVVSVTQGAKGSVAINVDQSITYTPNPGACGADAVTYTISDGRGGTATTSVSVNIVCVSGSVTHATVADFGPTCSVATDAIVSRAGDGEVRLAGVQGDEFSGTSLDLALWTAGTWAGGAYAPAPSGGVLSVSDANGAFVRSAGSLPVTALEASARFAGLPWQHLGWASLDFSGGYAVFSTYDTSTNLFARTNSGGGELQTNLGPIPSGFHSYRIDRQPVGPGSDTVSYYVDGLLVAQHVVGTVGSMHVYLSHNGGTAASLDVERLWVYPSYRGAGSFQSCTMDGGAAPFSWTKANWTANVPAGAALQVRTRTSPDGSAWSPWSSPVAASGQDIASPPGRYLQYLLEMSTTDSAVSPVVDSVVMGIRLDAVDAVAPVLSNVAVSNITGGSALVSWTTDEPSTSVVQFGPTRAYGDEALSASLVISHSVLLTGLTSGTPYQFRVVSRDGAGNEANSSNGAFTTPASSIAIGNVSVTEGNAGTATAAFVVSLSAPSTATVTVTYATAPGTATAPADYASTSGTLTFEPGVTSLPVIVGVAGDAVFELNETFAVNLSAPTGATISTGQGVGTIVNDDPAPVLSINDVSLTEGNSGTSTATFTVTLSPASPLTATVNYATANGTATAGSDYTATSGTLTFTPGATTRTFTVTTLGDTTLEPDETFVVTLSGQTNSTLGDGQATGTIRNNDAPALAINNVSVTEGNTGTVNATFTFTLSQPTTQTVTVNYATANATASSASDYASRSGTLTFVGTTTQTVSVPVNGDAQVEANETFVLNLSGASNATIGDAQGVATIVNDDLPTLSINEVSVTEGNSGSQNATFTVTLSTAVSQTVTVNYATANGTATAGSDYTAIPSTVLSFAPSQVTRTFTVAVTGDTAPEANETYFVNLSGATNATIADPQGLGTIADNDGTMTVTSPTTSSIWVIGSAQAITWTNNLGLGATVTLELSRNGGSSWTALGTGANSTTTGGSFAWTVTGPTTASADVRATWTINGNVTNTSSGTFDIVNGTLTVTTPPSGATWAIGSTQTIAWTNDFGTGATVNLELSRNGGSTWTAIGTGTNSSPTAGSFAWTVTGATTTTARVRATQVVNPSVADTNPGNFTIANPTITVNSPNGGNTWTVGSNQTITWSSNVPTTDNVRIELSLNGGATYPTVVLASTPNDGTQTVSVQSAWRTTQARIRVVWLTNTAVSDASNANFTIP